MINWFILVSQLYAADDVTTYCFDKNTSVQSVVNKVNFLKVKTDQFNLREDENCLDIITESSRIGLYEKFINLNFKPTSNSSSLNNQVTNCNIEVIENINGDIKESNLNLGEKNAITRVEGKSNGYKSGQFIVSPHKKLSVTFGTLNLNIECQKLNDDEFNLIFSSQDSGNALASQLIVRKNNETELGEVLSKFDTDTNKVSVTGIELKDKKENKKVNYKIKVY